jgi:hypothetical protein
MRPFLAVVLMGSLCIGQTWRMRSSASIPDGVLGFALSVCGDADHDSLPDFTFWRGTDDGTLWLWRVLEYRSYGRFDVVQSETCVGDPYPDSGIHKGVFMPTAVGDLDADGLAEYVGGNTDWGTDSTLPLVCVYEAGGTGPEQFPDTLVWMASGLPYIYGGPYAWLPGDLDRDGFKDILWTDEGWTYIFENRGNNQYALAFQSPVNHCGYDYAFGDFDRDSATEFVFANVSSDCAHVYECTGNDQYALVDSFPQHDGRNGHDIVNGGDLDGDGRPEFYIIYNRFTGSVANFFICMYEAVGNNEYACTVIDSIMGVSVPVSPSCRHSAVADVDGDDTLELVVSYFAGVRVYKAVADNQFRRYWDWVNPSPGEKQSFVACYDMNRNGYQDIVISGNGHTWMYEMEGVRVLSPKGGQSLVPGESCTIRWRVYTPPRCDSVSLFLRRDSTWDLDTIATGIAPTESSYNWVVSPGPVDSGRIVAIAYGPGWLFDESDSTFSILPGGCEEAPAASLRNWALWVWPNPATSRARVRFDVPHRVNVDVSVLDACGRVVRTLASGELAAGHYERRLDAGAALPAGVYVLRLAADGMRLSRKVVLTGR